MQFGVNLLPLQKAALAEKRISQRLKSLLVGLLVVYTIFLAGLFIFSVYVFSSRQKLQVEIEKIETEIKSFERKETLAVTLKNRIEAISQILNGREKDLSQEQLFMWAQSLVIPGISFQEMNLSWGEISLQGEAADVLALSDFLEHLRTNERKFSWLNLESLTRSKKGDYAFSLKGALSAKNE